MFARLWEAVFRSRRKEVSAAMAKLRDAVGPAQPNRSADVSTVQVLLNRNQAFLVPMAPLSIDGRFGPGTRAAIEAYQKRVMHMAQPDGVVSPGGPTLLFERHVFSKETGGKYDAKHPELSNRTPGEYGRFADQYGRLERAAALDRTAAYRSCSWGMFQIMGYHHARCGHGTVDAFVAAMQSSVSEHLTAFTRFIASDASLLRALRSSAAARSSRPY
jgi:peptidoglycan hydrolase-like protein with peptidoglycan-binding domain